MLQIQNMNSTTGTKNLRRYFSAKGDINMENNIDNYKFDNLQNALMETGGFKINLDQRHATQQVSVKGMKD